MNSEEKEMLKNHQAMMIKVLKASGYTLAAVLVILGLSLMLQDDAMSIILASIIVIIFLIFYFAITILEEIRKPK